MEWLCVRCHFRKMYEENQAWCPGCVRENQTLCDHLREELEGAAGTVAVLPPPDAASQLAAVSEQLAAAMAELQELRDRYRSLLCTVDSHQYEINELRKRLERLEERTDEC